MKKSAQQKKEEKARTLLHTASGINLENAAYIFGVLRRTESDASLRARALHSVEQAQATAAQHTIASVYFRLHDVWPEVSFTLEYTPYKAPSFFLRLRQAFSFKASPEKLPTLTVRFYAPTGVSKPMNAQAVLNELQKVNGRFFCRVYGQQADTRIGE